jgi:hypothetical protein
MMIVLLFLQHCPAHRKHEHKRQESRSYLATMLQGVVTGGSFGGRTSKL